LPGSAASGPASFALSPSEELLLTLGADGRLVGTELTSGRARFAVEATKKATVSPGAQRIATSHDGAWVAISGTHRDGTPWNPGIPVVEIRSTKDGALVRALSPTWTKLTALAFTPDRTLLVGGADDGGLLTWDTASGILLTRQVA